MKENPLRITIENDGPPLSDDIIQNLFTPFYSTKADGQGVGLMFVREVLLNHQCKFDFYSDNGWTIFDIYLS